MSDYGESDLRKLLGIAKGLTEYMPPKKNKKKTQKTKKPLEEHWCNYSTLCLFVQAAAKLLDEMCHLTAQSLNSMDTSEHFKVLKLLGEGSYGKVMLAVHRKRGEELNKHIMASRSPKNTPTSVQYLWIFQVLRWLWSSSLVTLLLCSLSWGSITSPCHSVHTHPWPELWE